MLSLLPFVPALQDLQPSSAPSRFNQKLRVPQSAVDLVETKQTRKDCQVTRPPESGVRGEWFACSAQLILLYAAHGKCQQCQQCWGWGLGERAWEGFVSVNAVGSCWPVPSHDNVCTGISMVWTVGSKRSMAWWAALWGMGVGARDRMASISSSTSPTTFGRVSLRPIKAPWTAECHPYYRTYCRTQLPSLPRSPPHGREKREKGKGERGTKCRVRVAYRVSTRKMCIDTGLHNGKRS